jgi:hypothetical protein
MENPPTVAVAWSLPSCDWVDFRESPFMLGATLPDILSWVAGAQWTGTGPAQSQLSTVASRSPGTFLPGLRLSDGT